MKLIFLKINTEFDSFYLTLFSREEYGSSKVLYPIIGFNQKLDHIDEIYINKTEITIFLSSKESSSTREITQNCPYKSYYFNFISYFQYNRFKENNLIGFRNYICKNKEYLK